jgi:hypothetical protein
VVDGINEAGGIFGATFLGGLGEGVAVGGGEEREVGAKVQRRSRWWGFLGLGGVLLDDGVMLYMVSGAGARA